MFTHIFCSSKLHRDWNKSSPVFTSTVLFPLLDVKGAQKWHHSFPTWVLNQPRKPKVKAEIYSNPIQSKEATSQVGFSKSRHWNRVWVQNVCKRSKEGEESGLSSRKSHRWSRPQEALPTLAGSSGVSIAHESPPIVSRNVWASACSPSSFNVGCPGKGMLEQGIQLFAAKADLRRTGSWRCCAHHPLLAGQKSFLKGPLGSTSSRPPQTKLENMANIFSNGKFFSMTERHCDIPTWAVLSNHRPHL